MECTSQDNHSSHESRDSYIAAESTVYTLEHISTIWVNITNNWRDLTNHYDHVGHQVDKDSWQGVISREWLFTEFQHKLATMFLNKLELHKWIQTGKRYPHSVSNLCFGFLQMHCSIKISCNLPYIIHQNTCWVFLNPTSQIKSFRVVYS